MDDYEMYCLTDPVFYDTYVLNNANGKDFPLAQGEVPEGWRRDEVGDWVAFTPQAPMILPAQGWKIHASACPGQRRGDPRDVWDYCVASGIAFKFIRSRELLFLRNVKYADRAGQRQVRHDLSRPTRPQLDRDPRELGAAARRPAGPVHPQRPALGRRPAVRPLRRVRERYCVGARRRARARRSRTRTGARPRPARPDLRGPAWVTLPEFLAPHLAARNSATVADLPYRIERALHFSNGGGVYAASHLPTGEQRRAQGGAARTPGSRWTAPTP